MMMNVNKPRRFAQGIAEHQNFLFIHETRSHAPKPTDLLGILLSCFACGPVRNSAEFLKAAERWRRGWKSPDAASCKQILALASITPIGVAWDDEFSSVD
ncbi:unnamed protein product [Toxocara canis]|uniref:Uncharacterized protein n=1 Tax=Toxocara canis TaxID=6265 RepID=A0A183UA13_TOXCA|nr:unnamed protein product [Toxocara canis]